MSFSDPEFILQNLSDSVNELNKPKERSLSGPRLMAFTKRRYKYTLYLKFECTFVLFGDNNDLSHSKFKPKVLVDHQ